MWKRLRVVAVALVLVLGGMPVGGQNCTGCDPEEPEYGGCRMCDAFEGVAYCRETAPWGEASSWVCVGGTYCEPVANGPPECQPNCGRRCYSI
jgi:hypothetical protein